MADNMLPDLDPRDSAPSAVQNVGEVALRVSRFDTSSNAVEGMDISTGEVMRIQMAGREDFARYYVDPERFPNEADRLRRADQQLVQRKDTEYMRGPVRDPRIDTIIQFQSVKSVPGPGGDGDDRYIARWANQLTTDRTYEAAGRAMVEVKNQESSSPFPLRVANAYFLERTEGATAEGLGRMTSNQMYSDQGVPIEGRARSTVLISISDGEKTFTGAVSTPYDKEARQDRPGVEAFLSQPQTRNNALPVAALMGRLGIEIDGLNVRTRPDGAAVTQRNRAAVAEGELDALMDKARQVHALAANGKIAVAITPGVSSSVMRYLNEHITKLEGDNSAKRMLGRGWFEADVSLQSQPPKVDNLGNDLPARSLVKEIRPVGFVHALGSESHQKIAFRDLGEMAIVKAEERNQKLYEAPEAKALVAAAATRSAAPTQEPAPSAPERQREPEPADDPYTAGFGMPGR